MYSVPCAVCGYLILDADQSLPHLWKKRFRGLYSSPEGVIVSGIGEQSPSTEDDDYCTAPASYSAKWDDPKPPVMQSFGVVNGPPFENRHGVLIHAACWSLLEAAFHPHKVPLQRLLEVFRSLPENALYSLGRKGLERNGGQEDLYPWLNSFRTFDSWPTRYQQDLGPYDLDDVRQVLDSTPKYPSFIVDAPVSGSPPFSASLLATENDCFFSLPGELRQDIASYLPTRDFLTLRRASRAFWPVFHSQQFWASKFSMYDERGWVFEARMRSSKASIPDWRWWWHRTRDCNERCGPDCGGYACHCEARDRNYGTQTGGKWKQPCSCDRGTHLAVHRQRTRVWRCICSLHRILSVYWDVSPILEAHPVPEHMSWIEVSGDIKRRVSLYRSFKEGCRVLEKRLVTIPSTIRRIGFSFVPLDRAEYISGMRFITNNNEDIKLGFQSSARQVVVDVSDNIRGFIVGADQRGLRAIQIITSDGCATRWVGCPKDVPKTRRLAAQEGPVAALECGFDALKIISLAIPTATRHPHERNRLRNDAFWYPDIPNPCLELNEHSFPQRDQEHSTFRPIAWNLFGGPSGIYLRNLTGINVTADRIRICGIKFQHNSRQIPAECRQLGRWPWSTAQEFCLPIDGPNGELLTKVELYIEFAKCADSPDESLSPRPGERVHDCLGHGVLAGLTLATNWGNQCHFGATDGEAYQRENHIGLKRVFTEIAPGTTITGFYAQQVNGLRHYVSLGVISEVIQDIPGSFSR